MKTLRKNTTNNLAENVGVIVGMTVVALFWLFIGAMMLFIPVGWVLNIFDVMAIDTTYGLNLEGALHIVGVIVIPLGAVMGIFF